MVNDSNGKSKWIFYLVGLIVTLVVLIAMPTMATQIWTNDRNNTIQHDKIKELMFTRDENIHGELSNIRVEQMRQRTILERIEKKL